MKGTTDYLMTHSRHNWRFRDAIQQQLDYHKTLDPRNQLKMQFVAIRTRYFDDFIVDSLPDIDQVVLLGSGLDTRAYRLPLTASTTIFEIDLPQIIDYKLSVMKPYHPKCNHHALAGDVTSSKWHKQLITYGYRPHLPTIWVMEGLLMYLTETHVHQLLSTISELSASNSRIISDLVSVKSWSAGAANKEQTVISGHWKFGCDEPEVLFANHNWDVTVQQPGDIRANYGRYTVELQPRYPKGVAHSIAQR